MKRQLNLGLRSSAQHYYRDSNKVEIDWILNENRQLHPVEIKMTNRADPSMTASFRKLDTTETVRTDGAVISLDAEARTLSPRNISIPAWLI
jgi:predicted AAA+ superfamily ATPase